MLTLGVYGPMNEELTKVGGDAPADVLALAKENYEAPWNVWNGVRTNCSSLALLALIAACFSRR